jgi:hypothetical protein
MILREVVQDCFVDLAVPEYRLVLFEAKAPQPTCLTAVHDHEACRVLRRRLQVRSSRSSSAMLAAMRRASSRVS